MKYVAIIDSDDELLEEATKALKETLFLGDENAMYCFEITSIKQAPEKIGDYVVGNSRGLQFSTNRLWGSGR